LGAQYQFDWTEERINFLKLYYPHRQYDLLFRSLDGYDNIDCIRHFAKKMGVKVVGYRYTDDETNFIKNNYDKLGYDKIAKILNKSYSGIQTQVAKMGLIKSEKWTEKEISLLKEFYAVYSNDYLSRKVLTNRKAENINNMACKLGLNKSVEKRNKIYEKQEMLEKLYELSIKLNRTPLVEELVPNGLPSSKTYERYFDGYQTACRTAGLEPNYDLWGRAKVFYSSNGDICFSNAELIVTEFFIQNKINYKKDTMYRDVVNDIRCGTKRTDWILDDGSIVEYWGYPKVEDYIPGMELKIKICNDNKIKLIELNRKDLTKLHKIFSQYI